MNLIDIIILVVLCCFAAKGLMRGLVNEASSLAGLLVGGWLAYHYYRVLAGPARTVLHLPEHVASFVSFVLILLLTGICAHIIGNVVTTALRLVMLGSLNRLGGLLLGTAEGALLLCLLFGIAVSAYMPEQLRQRVRASESANLFATTGEHFLKEWRGQGARTP